jgi:hypothetical protein
MCSHDLWGARRIEVMYVRRVNGFCSSARIALLVWVLLRVCIDRGGLVAALAVF